MYKCRSSIDDQFYSEIHIIQQEVDEWIMHTIRGLSSTRVVYTATTASDGLVDKTVIADRGRGVFGRTSPVLVNNTHDEILAPPLP